MFMGAGSINIMIGNIFNHVVKPMSFGIWYINLVKLSIDLYWVNLYFA